MPRPPSDLVPITVRVPEPVRDRVDVRAQTEGVDRSEFTRRALLYALDHMPPGWQPDEPVRVGFLVTSPNGNVWAGTDEDAARDWARDVRGFMARVPVVADYRTEGNPQ